MSIQLALPLILEFNISNKNGHFRQLLMWVRLRWMTLGWSREVLPSDSTSRTEILAQEIVKDYPDYDVIWNNCQKFVAYLLRTASPSCPLPTTLEAMFLSQPHSSKVPTKTPKPVCRELILSLRALGRSRHIPRVLNSSPLLISDKKNWRISHRVHIVCSLTDGRR
jgi:hypothetical protein